MPHAYCTTCEATITVGDGRCLAGHTITTPILESHRGRHRAPSRWEKLRLGRTMTAGHHRADGSYPSGRVADPEPRLKPTPPSSPPARPASKPADGPASTARPVPRQPGPAAQPTEMPAQAARLTLQPNPRPVALGPVGAADWLHPESAPRSVYSSSMLEMLGLDEEAGYEPTFTTMTSPRPVWQAPAQEATTQKAGLDRLPTLSDMRMVDDSHTDTGTLIERLWFATEEHEAVRPAADLKASDFADIPSRTFRWSVIVSAGLVLAIAVAVLLIGVRWPARIAKEATVTYRIAVTQAQDVLPIAREVMLAITDPAVTIEDLSDAAVALSQVDTASRHLFTTASEPLSSTPPLVSRDRLDALAPLRSQMANASQDGLAIERRLGDALTYRLLFDKAFTIPQLPTTAAPDEISALGVELALGLAATLDTIAALPHDPAFEAHRTQAQAVADRYAVWQVEYLSALRTTDLAAATALVTELQTAVGELKTGISVPLQAVAAWAADEIDRFDTTLAGLAAGLG